MNGCSSADEVSGIVKIGGASRSRGLMISIVFCALRHSPPTMFWTAYGVDAVVTAAGSKVAQVGIPEDENCLFLWIIFQHRWSDRPPAACIIYFE